MSIQPIHLQSSQAQPLKPIEPEKETKAAASTEKAKATVQNKYSSVTSSKKGFDSLESQAKATQVSAPREETSGQLDALSKFMKALETSTTAKKLASTLSNPLFNDNILGESRIVGLLSFLYDKTGQDGQLANGVIGQLIRYVNSDHDSFFIASILRTLTTNVQILDQENIKAITAALEKLNSPFPEVKDAAAELTIALTLLPPKEEILSTRPGIKTPEAALKSQESFRTPLLQAIPLPTQPLDLNDMREENIRNKGMSKIKTEYTANLRGSKDLGQQSFYSTGISPLTGPQDKTPSMLTPAIAIVTTPSATLPDSLLHYPGIRVITSDIDHYLKAFTDTFQQLFDQGFRTIYVILPDSDYWHACHYAKHAAYKMEEHIKVINAKTFGMGLRFIIEELAFVLYQLHNSKNLDLVVSRAISRVRYWVMPSMGTIRSQFWFSRLSRKSSKIPENSHPLMAFHAPIKVISNSPTFPQTADRLTGEVLQCIKSSKNPPTQITIEYNGLFQEADSLKKAIQVQYPKITCNIQGAPETLSNEFGKHLGLCMLVR